MIVREVADEVADEDAAQVRLTQNEDMVQTLAPDRADEPFHEGILPRALGGRQDFTDVHALHSVPERVAVDRVVITEEIGGCGVVRKGVHDLLGRPCGRGMGGHVEVRTRRRRWASTTRTKRPRK